MSAPPDHPEHHGPIVFPTDAHHGPASPGKIGMWIFLLSDAFSFGGLLLAYGILRGGATSTEVCEQGTAAKAVLERCWHSPTLHEPRLGINFTAALTFLLICSSVTMVMA